MDNENMHTKTADAKTKEGKSKLPEYYLHNPASDRFQDFIKVSQQIQKLLYNTDDYQPNIIKRTFTEKLTKNPKEGSMEAIKELICMDNGAKNLIIAPTGSGKTYSIDAIFKQIADESNGKELLCLLCPNRVQNVQNEKSDDYSFEALIEGIALEDNGKDIRQISAVYDKLPEIRKYKKEHPDCKLHVVIDECHTLISASLFREQAVSSIMRLIQSGEADSYTFITATYENMCVFPFDNIMLFEDKNYRPVFKSVDIRYTARKNLDSLIMATALNESKPFIRLNIKEKIKNLDKTLSDMGVNSQTVTADDKGHIKNDDGTVTYNNIIFDHIVNHDDLYNSKDEADVIFATSLLDAGTNFTKYSPKSTPVFVVYFEDQLNIDEIEQSFNRFRPQKDENGNVLQLDHAIILQPIPDHDITRIRVATHDNEGRSHVAKDALYIPPMTVLYEDQTTPEERKERYCKAVVTIQGKYLESLETGKYVLEFTCGDSYTVMTSNLYVNCKPDALDYDTLKSLMDTAETNIKGWLDDEKKITSHTLGMDAFNDIISVLDDNAPFIYNTGDETVSGSIPLRPYKWFEDLFSTLEDYIKKVKLRQMDFYDYYNRRRSLNADSINTIGGITEKELLDNVLNMIQKDDASGISKVMGITSSLKLWTDYNKLFNLAYAAYQKQYYYYPERLADELQRRLNIPVSISYPNPESYTIEKAEKAQEDRESVINNLNTLYRNPLTRDILCDVLHNNKKIPAGLEEGQRRMLSDIKQSSLYQKEYKTLKALPIMTFDYIVKIITASNSKRDTNKYLKRLKFMFNNQCIIRAGKPPFRDKEMPKLFREQSVLISIVNERKKKTGTKKFTTTKNFLASLKDEFNEKMASEVKNYKPKSDLQFNNLLENVYIIINKNIDSRKPELTEPILSVEDIFK